jgi:hypothetical protein
VQMREMRVYVLNLFVVFACDRELVAATSTTWPRELKTDRLSVVVFMHVCVCVCVCESVCVCVCVVVD